LFGNQTSKHFENQQFTNREVAGSNPAKRNNQEHSPLCVVDKTTKQKQQKPDLRIPSRAELVKVHYSFS